MDDDDMRYTAMIVKGIRASGPFVIMVPASLFSWDMLPHLARNDK